MADERSLRDRLEAAQARAALARRELATPVDVEPELAPFREELARLDAARAALAPVVREAGTQLDGQAASRREAGRQRFRLFRASVAVSTFKVVTGVVSGLAGVLLAGTSYLVALPGGDANLAVWLGAPALAAGAWVAYRLGRVA